MKKRLLLGSLAALTVAIFGLCQFQTRSLRAEFCRPFLEAQTVRVWEQQSDFPSKPQPKPRAIASFTGAQFSEFAQIVELKPRFSTDGCTGHSNALVFEALNNQNQAVADFALEKQVECGSWIRLSRNPAQWNQKFQQFRLTSASHAAIFELTGQKWNWKKQ